MPVLGFRGARRRAIIAADRGSFRLDRKQPGPQPASKEPHPCSTPSQTRHRPSRSTPSGWTSSWTRRASMSCSPTPSTTSSTCWAAIARSSSTTWTRWGSAAICRSWSIPRARREKAAFFGHRLESHQKEVNPFWTPEGNTNSAGSVDAMQKAIDYVRKSGVKAKRIGVEMAFLPADAAAPAEGRPRRQRGEERAVRAGAAARQ